MLFNSVQFLVWFFPIVTVLYFRLPHRYRWAWLLIASCYFYMAFIPQYILILAFTILVDYSAGILIEQSSGSARKCYLAASIVANVGVLALFKYFNFLNHNVRTLADTLHWNYPVPNLGWLLPIGLSFHTFQSMSYTIEVYRGRQAAERHFGILALYVLFYPQLVAGPIERPQNLLPQLRREQFFDYSRIVSGLQLMAWGLFQKVVIADSIAPFVDTVYSHPSAHSSRTLILATYAFAFQILCDFAGYSDVALGAAQVMGFALMRNFKQPYLSASIPEFWRRWHISLSSWFRDYVYIPLGGSKVERPKYYWNVMLVFLLSGLWHGANWTFVVWGALNGLYVIASVVSAPLRDGIYYRLGLADRNALRRVIQTVVTFHLVCLSWVLFRAGSISDALIILRRITHISNTAATVQAPVRFAVLIALLLCVHWMQQRMRLREALARQPVAVRWLVYYAGVAATLLLGQWFSRRQFVYFQF